MDDERREGLGSLQPLVLCEDVPGGKSAQCLSAAVCTDTQREVACNFINSWANKIAEIVEESY